MTKTPSFIQQILSEEGSRTPDRARFVADSAAYLFCQPGQAGTANRVQQGLASARACCCELRDRIRAALDGPERPGHLDALLDKPQ